MPLNTLTAKELMDCSLNDFISILDESINLLKDRSSSVVSTVCNLKAEVEKLLLSEENIDFRLIELKKKFWQIFVLNDHIFNHKKRNNHKEKDVMQEILDTLSQPSTSTTVNSVEEARHQWAESDFNRRVQLLRERISDEIDYLDMNKSHETANANLFMTNEMKKLLTVQISTEEELDYTEWLFNDGNLRTNEEIRQRQQSLENTKYVLSGDLKSDCAKRTYFFSLIPFFITCGIIVLWFYRASYHNWGPALFFGLPVGIVVGGFVGLIGSAIAHNINSSAAKNLNVPEADYITRLEKVKMGVSIGAAVGAAAHTVSHAKKSVKDITNVDVWKEIK